MPWYKTGTVSVTQNSNAVIGTGTSFIANSRVGDAFRGPDGAWYEVTNIASDTALSVSPNYQGATNPSGVYALAPMQGYVKDSADALRALVNTYGAKLAALGTTGNYDILPPSKGGTGITDLSTFAQGFLNDADAAAGRATLVAAKSGANADITSLTGLTTALSIAQGGTGNATGTATKLAAAAMVGTVSQSGGVPTGALMEYVTNGNGEAWKFANGLLICSRYFSSPIAFTVPPGTTAQSGAFALPVPAVGTGVKSYTGYATDAGTNLVGSSWIDFFGGLGWKFQVSNLSTTVTVTQLIAIQFIYVGRWF